MPSVHEILGVLLLVLTALFLAANVLLLHQDLFPWCWSRQYKLGRKAGQGRTTRQIRIEFLGGILTSSTIAFLGFCVFFWRLHWSYLLVVIPISIFHYSFYVTLSAIRFPRSAGPLTVLLVLVLPVAMMYAMCLAFAPLLDWELSSLERVLVSVAVPGVAFVTYFIVSVLLGYRPPKQKARGGAEK